MTRTSPPTGSIQTARPSTARTEDFDDFWRATLERLDAVPIDYKVGTVSRAPEGAILMPLRFRSLDGASIQGWLLSQADSLASPAPASRPLVVTTHGYASRCNPALEARHVARGVDVMCFDVRGCGLSPSPRPLHPGGYVLTGLTNPETSILRGAVCDYVRAAEVAMRVQRIDAGHLAFHGRSFGGALAIMAQAITNRASFLVVSVPTFGWAEGRRSLVKEGSGRQINEYLADHPAEEAVIMRTLSYFDTVNFARRVTCRTLVGLGLRDDYVPPETVYAIVNQMSPRPDVVELPVSHSTDPEESRWDSFDRRWVAEIVGAGMTVDE